MKHTRDVTRSVILDNPAPAVFLSTTGLVVDVNDAALALAGLDRSDLLGRPIWDIVTEPRMTTDDFDRLVAAGTFPDQLLRLGHPSRGPIDLVASGFLLHDAGGVPIGAIVTARDVTEMMQSRQALADQRDRLRLVLESSRLGMWDWDMETGAAVVDARFAEILGYTLDELGPITSTIWDEMTHPDDLVGAAEVTAEHLAGHIGFYDVEIRMRHRSGEWIWIRDRGKLVASTPDGRPSRMTGTIEDVAQARRNVELLAVAEEQFRRAMHDSATGMCLISPEGRFIEVNQAMCTLLGWDAGALKGVSWQEITHPEHLDVERALVREVLRGGRDSYRLQKRLLSTDGRTVWADVTVAVMRNDDRSIRLLIGQIVDDTDRHQAHDELTRLATHDSLTGLANRVVVGDELERALKAGRRTNSLTAVLMVDLDRFKYVNDSFGHGAGDELLCAAADRMRSTTRGGDLVARTGGDEFVVVMRELERAQEAVELAEQIVTSFRQPFQVHGREAYATASVGVAIASPLASGDDVIREADTAMYVAKADGRDRVVVFNDDLRDVVTTRLAVETDLRQALQRGELELWYQPEVDLASGSVIAVEALLRWRHHGLIRPADDFIAVAEETGLVVEIGDWVLRTACSDAAGWARRGSAAGGAIRVRVNVSARQLGEPGLLAALDRALGSSGLAPSSLTVEITETALLRSNWHALQTLRGIHERGVQIALDDFGTGYASLTYLREYPIDELKIDRSFITDITDDEFDRNLVAGLIALADKLRVSVVAEGVETSAQADCLRQLGCPSAQGFLYSQAVPHDQLLELLGTDLRA